MAGAIAFRMFIYVLPLVLVIVASLGGIADLSDQGPRDLAKTVGMGGLAAKAVSESARLDNGGRWIAIVLGLFALYFASIALARAMRIAHALAWQQAVVPMRKTWRAALIAVGSSLALLVVLAAVSRLRDENFRLGVLGLGLALFLYALGWFGLSLLLPHRDASWQALIPGAVLMAVGVEVLHVVTVLYLTPKVSSSSALYGPVGSAIAILLWAYLFGRLVVAAAILNATLWSRTPGAGSRAEAADRLADEHDAEDHEEHGHDRGIVETEPGFPTVEQMTDLLSTEEREQDRAGDRHAAQDHEDRERHRGVPG
jgi:uncharacterized BrkB/YihY/UPF0761 family membrane protein